MIIGDNADNVNYCKGYGKRYVERLFVNSKQNILFFVKHIWFIWRFMAY